MKIVDLVKDDTYWTWIIQIDDLQFEGSTYPGHRGILHYLKGCLISFRSPESIGFECLAYHEMLNRLTGFYNKYELHIYDEYSKFSKHITRG